MPRACTVNLRHFLGIPNGVLQLKTPRGYSSFSGFEGKRARNKPWRLIEIVTSVNTPNWIESSVVFDPDIYDWLDENTSGWRVTAKADGLVGIKGDRYRRLIPQLRFASEVDLMAFTLRWVR